MTEQAETNDRSGPRPAHPYGPGLPPYPGRHPYGPPQDETEVTIKLVDNGWIVTAPGESEDCFTDDQVRVFQFSQKPELLAFVDEATPRPKAKEKS